MLPKILAHIIVVSILTVLDLALMARFADSIVASPANNMNITITLIVITPSHRHIKINVMISERHFDFIEYSPFYINPIGCGFH